MHGEAGQARSINPVGGGLFIDADEVAKRGGIERHPSMPAGFRKSLRVLLRLFGHFASVAGHPYIVLDSRPFFWTMGSWMTHDDLISHYGTATKAADKLGYSKQAVSAWKKSGIPFDAQFRIQLQTRGKLKATLTERKRKAA